MLVVVPAVPLRSYAVSLAFVAFLITVAATVLMVSGNQDAAIIIALIAPAVTSVMNGRKVNEIHTEVRELGNGKMKAAVKEAVEEVGRGE